MLRPLRDRIVVKPVERQQSAVLTVISGEKYNLGDVLAVGPKVDAVSVGDRIAFGESKNDTCIQFSRYEEGRSEFLVMQEADVCFVIDS